MKTVKLEITFPDTFSDLDIQGALFDIENDMPAMKGLKPSVHSENTIFDKILEWAHEKGIIVHGDSKTQTVKLFEEAGELAHGILKQNREEIKDAIGDMIVVMVSIAHFNGLTVPECIEAAYEVISKRTGKMENGNFVKHSQ